MPQHVAGNGGRTKPPGGRRASGAEVQARLDFADKMLRDGRSRGDVVGAMASRFGTSTRAADSYIARARRRWVEESKGTREVERVAALNRLDRLSGKAEKRGQFGAAVSAEKLRAQVTGILATQAVEVKPAVATTTSNDEAMTDEQIVEELAECASFMAYMLVERRDNPLTPTPQIMDSVRLLVGEVRKLGQIVGVLHAPLPAPALPPSMAINERRNSKLAPLPGPALR